MLNAREEKFVAALVAGDSQRAAYRKAFKQSRKWKDATVDTKACLLWKQDKIQERYFEVREEVARAAHDEGIVTAKDILRELAKIGFADITDYLTVKSDLVQIKNTEDIPRARIGAISAIKQGNFGIEMKLHDKVRALELMALPAAADIPVCFRVLQFDTVPDSAQEIEKQFKRLVKTAHPDAGGTEQQFRVLQDARERAIKYLEEIDPAAT